MATKTTAYAYRSGHIGFGNFCPDGALPIARDWSKLLREIIEALAVHCYDGETLKVGGLATTDNDDEALGIFEEFKAQVQACLDNCGQRRDCA